MHPSLSTESEGPSEEEEEEEDDDEAGLLRHVDCLFICQCEWKMFSVQKSSMIQLQKANDSEELSDNEVSLLGSDDDDDDDDHDEGVGSEDSEEWRPNDEADQEDDFFEIIGVREAPAAKRHKVGAV